jgi:hypothetical protein
MSSKKDSFRLVRIQGEAVVREPLRKDNKSRFKSLDVSGSRGLRNRNEELGVISILMLLGDERCDWGDLYGEQKLT